MSIVRTIFENRAGTFMPAPSWYFADFYRNAAEHPHTYCFASIPMLTESLPHWLPSPAIRQLGDKILSEDKMVWDILASQLMESLIADVEQGWNQTTTRPSTRIVLFPALPQEVREQLDILCASSRDSDSLYETADALTEWLRESSTDYQATLASYLAQLSPSGARTLLSAFADAEIALTSVILLQAVAAFMHTEERRLAQVAATCLLICGGKVGKALVDEKLQTPPPVPHAELIQGIVNLLSGT